MRVRDAWLVAVATAAMVIGLAGCPAKPPVAQGVPVGPDTGLTKWSYTFSIQAECPKPGEVALRFDWGDGDTSDWSTFADSGATITMDHSWNAVGLFEVRVQASDRHGAVSDWSEARQMDIRAPGFPHRSLRSIALGWNIGDMAIVRSAEVLYVLSYKMGTLWMVRTADDSLVGSFPVGAATCLEGEVYASRDGQMAYITQFTPSCGGLGVAGVRTSDHVLVDTFLFGPPLEQYSWTLGLLPDGSRFYLPCCDDSAYEFVLLDVKTDGSDVDTIRPPWPHVEGQGMVFVPTPDGEHVYVVSSELDWVYDLRTSDNAFVDSIPVSGLVESGVMSASGEYLYIAGRLGHALKVRVADNAVVDSVALSGETEDLALSADGEYLYASAGFGNAIRVVRIRDLRVVDEIALPSPFTIAVHPAGDKVYVRCDDYVAVLGF